MVRIVEFKRRCNTTTASSAEKNIRIEKNITPNTNIPDTDKNAFAATNINNAFSRNERREKMSELENYR